MSPAPSSTLRCLETAARRDRMARRVGSARAEKVALRRSAGMPVFNRMVNNRSVEYESPERLSRGRHGRARAAAPGLLRVGLRLQIERQALGDARFVRIVAQVGPELEQIAPPVEPWADAARRARAVQVVDVQI